MVVPTTSDLTSPSSPQCSLGLFDRVLPHEMPNVELKGVQSVLLQHTEEFDPK